MTQIANQPITWQQLNAFRHLDVVKTICWSSNRASEWGRKGILVTLNVEWLLVPDELVWVFQKLLIYWDFHAQPSLGFTENIQWAAVVWTKMPCWCQRRMDRRVRDDRKATITQINTHCNQGMQNTISERTTRPTLKQMGYSNFAPITVALYVSWYVGVRETRSSSKHIIFNDPKHRTRRRYKMTIKTGHQRQETQGLSKGD